MINAGKLNDSHKEFSHSTYSIIRPSLIRTSIIRSVKKSADEVEEIAGDVRKCQISNGEAMNMLDKCLTWLR